MKTVILVSSIFYLLGLKISHKFDLIKNVTPVEKVIVQKADPRPVINAAEFAKPEKLTPATDTLCGGCSTDEKILESK